MTRLRFLFAALLTGLATVCPAQIQTSAPAPAAASAQPAAPEITASVHPFIGPVLPDSASADIPLSDPADLAAELTLPPDQTSPSSTSQDNPKPPASKGPVDAHGNPIPLERLQPTRILGFMPNFRTVSGGAQPHPPGFKYNFIVATHQATDYSSFIFLGLTSLTAEATDEHPSLGKGIEGFGQYTWRGFIDKTDGTYLSAWLLPSILHEDTRYYALGAGHSLAIRGLYIISRQGVARTYHGRNTPNIAGLGGKILTQYVSRHYYPPSAATFGVLATKFGYSVMRDVAFSSVREFYPDIAAHYVHKHREKEARLAAKRAAKSTTP
ncbi:MAG TPA: hypothetical protein VHZ09_03225 [Acidobacteriaceae bacterium]|jgi:hypothetical protein|nr:hypothetical protein [Acidobacteriaceae bacterium]